MNILLKDVAGAVVAELAGEIDGKTAPEAQTVVLKAMRDGGRLILDMTQITYLSSAGLRMLLLLERESTSRQAKIVLVGVRPEIQDVMNSTGFLRFLTLADTLEGGISLLQG